MNITKNGEFNYILFLNACTKIIDIDENKSI